MEWKDGFLTKAIEKGEIVILDNLQEANSTITERLNGFFDIKYDEDKKKRRSKKFDIPENPLKSSIGIHKNFRIIGICDNNTINQMSPAFLNRFDIIVLENQLTNISYNDLKELLEIIINKGKEESAIDRRVDSDLGSYLEDENGKEDNDDGDDNKKNEKILDKDAINHLAEKLRKFFDKNNNINKPLTFSDISRLCYSIKIFIENKGNEFKSVPKEN